MLEQLENANIQKESEIEELCLKYAEEIENFKKLTKNLQNQTEFLERENVEKEELNSALIYKLNEFKEELGKRDEFVFEQVAEDHEKLHQLNRALDNKTKMIEEGKTNLLKAKKDLQEMKRLLDAKNKEIDEQKNELKEFYERTQHFATTRDLELRELKEHHAKLLEEHNKIMAQYSQQASKAEDLAKENTSFANELRRLQLSEKKLKAQLGEVIEVGKNLNEEKNRLKGEVEALTIGGEGGHK